MKKNLGFGHKKENSFLIFTPVSEKPKSSPIRTSIHQEKEPDPVVKDSRGTSIYYGLRVACNIAGYVKIGTIRAIKQNIWKVSRSGVAPKNWWSLQFKMEVELEDGTFSIIKNPNSFLII